MPAFAAPPASGPKARPLSRDEQGRVMAILAQPPMAYVEHPLFEQAGAECLLLRDADPLPAARSDWYHPGLDDSSDAARARAIPFTPLTPTQERTIFLQFNYARRMVARLQGQLGRAPLEPRAARALLRWHDQALELRDQIVQFNLGLVLAMARKVAPATRDYSDLISEASLDLVRAVEKFDVRRNYKFSTYACHTIRHACGRALTRETRHRARFPVNFDPDLERPGTEPEPSEQSPQTMLDELRQVLQTNAAGLSEVERQILRDRFPLDEERPRRRRSLQDVGAAIGYSKERTRQLQKQALGKLRRAMEQRLAKVG